MMTSAFCTSSSVIILCVVITSVARTEGNPKYTLENIPKRSADTIKNQ